MTKTRSYKVQTPIESTDGTFVQVQAMVVTSCTHTCDDCDYLGQCALDNLSENDTIVNFTEDGHSATARIIRDADGTFRRI